MVVSLINLIIVVVFTESGKLKIKRKIIKKWRKLNYFYLLSFRCIVPYPPNSEFELELNVGDIVFVHKKRDNGWFKGSLARTGKLGLFPASFVEPDN